MATQLPSLFGATMDPEQMAEAKALQFSQMSPQQQMQYNIYRNVNRLGRGVAGLLGADVEDPTMKKASQLRQLASQFDTTTAEGMMQYAQALRNIDPNLAVQAAQQAQAMMKTEAEIGSTRALEKQRLREKQAASVEDKAFIALAAKATPASVAAAIKAGNDIGLLEVPENIKVSTYGQVLKDSGLTPGTPEFQKQMQAFAAAELESTKKGKGTNVNVAVAGQKAFVERLADLDAKRVSEAMTARDNANATIRSLDRLAQLDDQGLISGSYATGRVGATNLLNTLGLASPADQQRLASSQNYQKVAGDVILGVLGGKLGAGFSNDDRKFIEGLVPQLETSAAARRQLINFMRSKNMEIASEAQRLEDYAREKDSLKGFKPKLPLGGAIPASGMSIDDLAKAAGGKIVNGNFVRDK